MWNETIPLLAASANLLLGFLVIVNGPDRPLHRAFLMLMAVSFVWNFGTFRFAGTGDPCWHRFLTVGSVMLPAAAFRFFGFYLGVEPRRRTRWTRLLLAASAALCALALTPLFDTATFRLALSAYVFALLSALALVAFERHREADVPLERHRLGYVLAVLGIIATAALADVGRDLGLPLPRLGNLASLFAAVILTFAIIRHRLLDLEVVLRGSLIFAVLVVMAVPLHRLLYATQHRVSYGTIVTAVFLLVLATAVIFPWTTRWAQTRLTRAVLGSRSGRRGLLRAMRARASRGELDEPGLAAPLAAARAGLGAEWLLLGREDPEAPVEIVARAGEAPGADSFDARAVAALGATSGVIYRSELAIAPGGPPPEAAEVLAALEALGAELLVPAGPPDAPPAYLLAGPRQNDTAYDALDVAFFEELSQEVRTVLQAARARRLLEARSRLAALGEMSAAVAHEVRNPLAAMKGAVELLQRKSGDAGASDGKLLTLLAGEVERLERVVNDFLDYARPSPPTLAPERLSQIARRTLELLSRDPGLEGVAITLEAQVDPPPIPLDSEQIRQMLINLVRNAVQAMEGQGRVTIAIGRDGGEAVLRVRDTGPGFEPAILRRAFDPFFTTRSRGSGLGLAIARRIVERHGGRIQLRNHPAGGAEVIVAFPVPATAAAEKPEDALEECRA